MVIYMWLYLFYEVSYWVNSLQHCEYYTRMHHLLLQDLDILAWQCIYVLRAILRTLKIISHIDFYNSIAVDFLCEENLVF
jgi:hypothetical protein